MKHLIIKPFIFLLFIFLQATAYASQNTISDSAALGNMKVGKSVFLVDIGDAKKLNFYLQVIQGTHKNMKEQGVKPDFVLVYIGPSVKYLTSEPSMQTEKEAAGLMLDIESNIEALAALGIRQEVCAVATRVFGVKNNSVFKGLSLVRDGFISLIGYQQQGYHLVPVF